MDLEFFMAWGAPQTLADSLGRYPDACFTLVLSPGAPDLLLAELRNVNTADAVTVGTRTDSPDYFAASGIVNDELIAALEAGDVDSLLVSQNWESGSREWVTTSTPELPPEPAPES